MVRPVGEGETLENPLMPRPNPSAPTRAGAKTEATRRSVVQSRDRAGRRRFSRCDHACSRTPGLPRRGDAGPLPSSRTPQCFGVIFPAKVWVTIFPSFTTKVSVPHGYGCSVIGRGEAGDCAVEPEPVLEVRAILPRRDDLRCCVAALRSGFTVGETEGLAELVGGEFGAPGRSSNLLTPRLGNRARVHRVETGVLDQPHDELLAFGRVS